MQKRAGFLKFSTLMIMGAISFNAAAKAPEAAKPQTGKPSTVLPEDSRAEQNRINTIVTPGTNGRANHEQKTGPGGGLLKRQSDLSKQRVLDEEAAARLEQMEKTKKLLAQQGDVPAITREKAIQMLTSNGFTTTQANQLIDGMAAGVGASSFQALNQRPALQNLALQFILGKAEENATFDPPQPASALTLGSLKQEIARLQELSVIANGPDGQPVDVAARILKIQADHVAKADANKNGKIDDDEIAAHNKTISTLIPGYTLKSPVTAYKVGLVLGLAEMVRLGTLDAESARKIAEDC